MQITPGQELEARMIGMRIRELTDPEKGCLVWDKEEGCLPEGRSTGDIVILLRSVSGWAESFVETLGHYGNPGLCRIEEQDILIPLRWRRY